MRLFEGWCSHVQERLIGTQSNETPLHIFQKQTVKERHRHLDQPIVGSEALNVLLPYCTAYRLKQGLQHLPSQKLSFEADCNQSVTSNAVFKFTTAV